MDGWVEHLLRGRHILDPNSLPCEICSHTIGAHEIVPDGPPLCTVEGCDCGKDLPPKRG